MILSFYVWQTRTLPRTWCPVWHRSHLLGESAHGQESLTEPLLVRATPQFTVSFPCHQTVRIILDPWLTGHLSPPLAAKLPYHLGMAVSLAPDVTQGVSSWKADTWSIITLSVLRFNTGIPTDPPPPGIRKFHFLQLKECLCSRLRFTFMPCATRVTDLTWQNTNKEGILNFATRLSLLLQVHWDNTLTGHTNPSGFNGRAASSAGDQISLLPSNFALRLHWNKIQRQHSDGALFYDTKA